MQLGRLVSIAAIAVLVPSAADSQEPTRRRQAPIEIRGQVPTPQVVTVRPREVPAYSRQVLVPDFYDHDFWPSILPPYLLVPQRTLTGEVPVDSLTMRGDTAAVRNDTTSPQPARMSPDTVRPVTPPPPMGSTPPSARPFAPGDSARRAPGTPSARSPR